VINTGGWLLLTAIFSALLLLVQRSERKRRLVSLLILAIVGLVVWNYAIYRMSGDCDLLFKIVCEARWMKQKTASIAYNTANWAVIASLLFNLFFWVIFGRSNPPGSSDSIQVFGMND
jgi:drug/metabolite transporter (DMT)-like permease